MYEFQDGTYLIFKERDLDGNLLSPAISFNNLRQYVTNYRPEFKVCDRLGIDDADLMAISYNSTYDTHCLYCTDMNLQIPPEPNNILVTEAPKAAFVFAERSLYLNEFLYLFKETVKIQVRDNELQSWSKVTSEDLRFVQNKEGAFLELHYNKYFLELEDVIEELRTSSAPEVVEMRRLFEMNYEGSPWQTSRKANV